MGWYGSYCSEDLKSIKSKIEEEIAENNFILYHSFSYGQSYLAIQNKNDPDKRVFALVVLWKYSKKDFQLMTKIMDETCGPYYCKAPKKLLNMLTEPINDYAHNWRVTCWQRFKNIPEKYKSYKEE